MIKKVFFGASYLFFVFGIIFSASAQTLSASSLAIPFQVGDFVYTTDVVNVRSTPSGSILGSQPVGAIGKIISQYQFLNNYVWWQVDWDKGYDGWSVQDYLKNIDLSPEGSGDTSSIGHWQMSSTTLINDVSGNGRNGTISGSLQSTVGKLGYANVFDGNDSISIGDVSAYNFGSSGDFAIAGWFKVPTIGSGNMEIINKRTTCNLSSFYRLNVEGGTGKLVGAISDSTGNPKVKSLASVVNNNWTHFVFMRSGGVAKLYINGTEQGSVTGANKNVSNTGAFKIGSSVCSDQGASVRFNGQLDDIRVYNRALTLDDISKLSGRSGVVTIPSPIITSLSPNSGMIGTQIFINGSGFTPTGNSIIFSGPPGSFIKLNVSSSNGTILPFTVPQYTNNCLNSPECTLPEGIFQPGEYSISVDNVYGKSASIPFTITSSGKPDIKVSLPVLGQSVSKGSLLTISWQSTNAPYDANVRLEIYPATSLPVIGNNDNGIASTLSPSGTRSWTVPVPDSPLVADTSIISGLPTGKYKIVAKLYTGNTCWGYCLPGTARTILAQSESAVFDITQAGLPTFTTSRTSGVAPLNVSFYLTGASGAPNLYGIDFGDGVIASNWSTGFENASDLYISHTYTQAGQYNVTVSKSGTLVGRAAISVQSATPTTPPPTVDIKANGSDNPSAIPYNTTALISWTSTNATSCTDPLSSISGGGPIPPGGTDGGSLSGSVTTPPLTSSRTFTVSCIGSGGSNQDSVTVPVQLQSVPTEVKFESVKSSVKTYNVSGMSYTVDIGSNQNRMLVVGVEAENSSGAACDVRGITYAGEQLYPINSQEVGGGTVPRLCVGLWYLKQPPSGSNTLVVTMNSSVSDLVSGAMSLYNVAQEAPYATAKNSNSGQSTVSTSINASVNGSMVVDAVGHGYTENLITDESAFVERYDLSGQSARGAGSTFRVSSAGSVIMGWNFTASTKTRMAHVVAAFKPASATVAFGADEERRSQLAALIVRLQEILAQLQSLRKSQGN